MLLTILIDPFVNSIGADWLAELNIYSITIRLVLAILFGGLLGLERAIKHHAAGFRTYILVCVGATIAMITNEFICKVTNTGDGARLGAQVISGIGFLGAGSIMFTSRNQVKGLTTAAGLWACACLGLAIGVGFYSLAVISTIIIIGVLASLPSIDKALRKKSKMFAIHIEFECRANLKEFIKSVRDLNFKVLSIENNPAYSQSGLSVYSIELLINDKKRIPHINYIEEFQKFTYVNYVEEIY